MTRKLLIRVNGTLEVKFIAGVWAHNSVNKVGVWAPIRVLRWGLGSQNCG